MTQPNKSPSQQIVDEYNTTPHEHSNRYELFYLEAKAQQRIQDCEKMLIYLKLFIKDTSGYSFIKFVVEQEIKILKDNFKEKQ